MQLFGLSLNIGGWTLKYGNIEFPLVGDESNDGAVRRVLLAEDASIPAQSESIVWGKIESYETGMKTALIESEGNGRNGLAVGKSLVIVREDKLVPIRVMNLAAHDMTRIYEKIVQSPSAIR